MRTRHNNKDAKDDAKQELAQSAASESLDVKSNEESADPNKPTSEDVESEDQPLQPSKPQSTTKKGAKRKSKWDKDNVLVDPKSPLASFNLRKLISNPKAWDALDAQEQRDIAALFPDQGHIIGDPNSPRLDYQSLMNDDGFHASCQSYVNDLADGRHDISWLASAWEANERRRAGDFDDHSIKKVESDWDIVLPTLKDPESPESADKDSSMQPPAGQPVGS